MSLYTKTSLWATFEEVKFIEKFFVRPFFGYSQPQKP